jgi:hypothetical protein
MKIVIRKKGVEKPIRVYHDAKIIRYNRKENTIKIRDTNDPIAELFVYHLTKTPILEWFTCENSTDDEILVEFEVE